MFESLGVSLRLGLTTAGITVSAAVFLAILIHRLPSAVGGILDSAITLPQILPPTVLGFFLLFLFSPSHGVGEWLYMQFGLRLVFTFPLIVVGAVITTLPAAYNMISRGFDMIPPGISEGSRILGFSPIRYVLKVQLPLIRPSLIAAFALSFGQSLGAFGVIYMLGGNIPGRTRTVSVYLFEEMQLLHWDQAAASAGFLMLLSMGVLMVVRFAGRRSGNVQM